MTSILFQTALVAASLWLVEATGTVYPCLNEAEVPETTCFNSRGQSWGIVEDFDRPIGSRIRARFYLQPIDHPDGDAFRVVNVEIEEEIRK